MREMGVPLTGGGGGGNGTWPDYGANEAMLVARVRAHTPTLNARALVQPSTPTLGLSSPCWAV